MKEQSKIELIKKQINVAKTTFIFCIIFAAYKGFTETFDLWTISFISVFILCSMGLHYNSRIAAAIGLTTSVLFGIASLNFTHPAMSLLFTATLVYYSIQGIRGTFSYHKSTFK